MAIRKEVWDFLALGRLPTTAPLAADVTPAVIARHEAALNGIPRPVSDHEAAVLVTGFGTDDCFGLAWSLIHLIETSPAAKAGRLLTERPAAAANEWVWLLWERAQRT